jgi:hypothetical protein
MDGQQLVSEETEPRREETSQREQTDRSETNTVRAMSSDRRNTIDGEAFLVNPPLLRKIEHLSVTASSDPAIPSSQQGISSRSSPDFDRVSPTHRGMLTPDPNRRSPAGGSSPSTSQVSVGSVPPTLVAAAFPTAPRGHFDLTPVTRNTSRDYVEDTMRGGGGSTAKGAMTKSAATDHYAVVSPEDRGGVMDEFLHGEHLALPSDLTSEDGPPMPPLQPERSRSLGTLDHEALRQHDAAFDRHEVGPDVAEPVQFPARKFYTFTSREQYEEAINREQQHQAYYPQTAQHQAYQPSRDDDLEGVGTLPPEALRQIFITRRPSADASSSASEESHGNHRLVFQNPFPLGERQGSIPSIHMAHQLHGSATSYTDHTENTEDEESLLYLRGGDDEASLSSRGSSLYLPDHDKEIASAVHSVPSLGPSLRGAVVMEELNRVMVDARRNHPSSALPQARPPNDGEDVDHARRKRKQLKKEEKQKSAMDWLQSVEADQNVLAEAASSKFLTGRGPQVTPTSPSIADAVPPLADRNPSQRRQTMPPVFAGSSTAGASQQVP